MGGALLVDVVTIFPGMLTGFTDESIISRAVQRGIVNIRVTNLRDFTHDRHKTTDDRPYGGGPGMVMKPEPFFEAVEALKTDGCRVILMTPQGRRFEQKVAKELSGEKHLIFLCGHYEGVDERVGEGLATDAISVGDYVLTNGTIAAAVVIDATVRLLPGVLGCGDSLNDESFNDGLVEYPQYTRPSQFMDMKVPEVLLSGDHNEIRRWREKQSRVRTKERRADRAGGVS